jgi:hypothetical protein
MLLAAYWPAGWDPTVPTMAQLFARGWAFTTATRLRRFTLLPVYLQLCLCTAALTFPAEAHAAIGPQSPLMYVLGVTDSYGVPLSRYTISTDYGTVFDGGSQAVLATLLQAEAALFVVIGGVAIWLLMYVISFGFLPDLVQPFATVAQDYAAHIIPAIAAIAALIAATIIAINVLRQNFPRATSQAAAALLVAVIGGALIYSPISWVISSQGPLAMGRDAAVSLGSNSVAGLTNTKDTLNRLEGTLATSFVRHPLQTWNFAGQPDDTPSCATAWTNGVNSGDPDRIKDGIRACDAPNSAAMKASADNPSPGQLGTGVLMLFFVGIFALFCAVLAFHIVLEFFHAVANAVRMLWGFAIGVIPGAPQASLVNTFVAVMFSFVAMFAYITATIFIGEVVTVIFRQQGNGVVAMLSALMLMAVAIRMIFKLSKGLKESSSRVATEVLNSVGASPAPTMNILHEKSGAFLRETGTVALGVGATLVGGALAKHSPSAAHALDIIAPHVRSGRGSVVRNMDRGARKYNDDRRDERIDRTAETVEQMAMAARHGGPDDDDPPPPPPADPPPSPPPPPPPAPNGPPLSGPSSSAPPRTTPMGTAAPSTRGNGAQPQPPPAPSTPLTNDDVAPRPTSAPPGRASTGSPPPAPPAAPRTGSASELHDLDAAHTDTAPPPTDTAPPPRPPSPAPKPPTWQHNWPWTTGPDAPTSEDAAPPSPFEPHPVRDTDRDRRGPATGDARPLPPLDGGQHD